MDWAMRLIVNTVVMGSIPLEGMKYLSQVLWHKRVTINATVVCSTPIRGNKLFNIFIISL